MPHILMRFHIRWYATILFHCAGSRVIRGQQSGQSLQVEIIGKSIAQIIKEIGGAPYLFLEWKSGDVTIAGMKPHYYVLKPKPAKATQ